MFRCPPNGLTQGSPIDCRLVQPHECSNVIQVAGTCGSSPALHHCLELLCDTRLERIRQQVDWLLTEQRGELVCDLPGCYNVARGDVDFQRRPHTAELGDQMRTQPAVVVVLADGLHSFERKSNPIMQIDRSDLLHGGRDCLLVQCHSPDSRIQIHGGALCHAHH